MEQITWWYMYVYAFDRFEQNVLHYTCFFSCDLLLCWYYIKINREIAETYFAPPEFTTLLSSESSENYRTFLQ